ncbi:glycosyltransferase [Bacteroidales bacterium SW299]|nr:glycosyltransferase [Bacteroidales bacterium SW299]
MNNIIFITRYYGEMLGGTVCSQRNRKSLEQIFDNLFEYKIIDKKRGRLLLSRAEQLCFGYMGGIDCIDIQRVKHIILNKNCNYAFIDSSLLGSFAKILRQVSPKIKIICFFHNCEYMYINSIYKGIKRSLYSKWAFKCERQACKYADTLIALNERDSQLITNLYQRKPELCIPISIEDKTTRLYGQNGDKYILFVGSYFQPNIVGIQWFMKEVLPAISVKLKIVGRNMNLLQVPAGVKEKVEIISNAEDLSPYYQNAQLVVMPIFTGGGMKVKTAEALMYGKTIIGTKEAFEGYKLNAPIFYLCQTNEEFIKTISSLYEKTPSFNKSSRELFLSEYSFEATLALFRKIK